MNEKDNIIEVEATVHEETAEPKQEAPQQTYTFHQQPQAKNSKAVPAFVLGLLAIILTFVPVVGTVSIILAIIGLVFGSKAKHFAKEHGGEGIGLANAGFICSLIALILWVVVIVIVGIVIGVGVAMMM